MFETCEVIHSYTRAEAIEDGVLVDLSSRFPDVCRQLYRSPSVACTAAVWGILEQAANNPKHCNEMDALVWDLLFMSFRGVVKRIDPTSHFFEVIISGTARGGDKYYTFKAVCGPNDDGSPCITISLPEED